MWNWDEAGIIALVFTGARDWRVRVEWRGYAPALQFLEPLGEKRSLGLCQGSTSQFGKFQGNLTWFLFDIHFFFKTHLITEGDQSDRLWSLLAAGSVSQSEKEITWSGGNGNMVWEEVSSRLGLRRPDSDNRQCRPHPRQCPSESPLGPVRWLYPYRATEDFLTFLSCSGTQKHPQRSKCYAKNRLSVLMYLGLNFASAK